MKHVLLALSLLPALVLAVEDDYSLTIRNHQFVPDQLVVSAGKKIKLVISNADSTPEEFESYTLNREKVIPGNSKASVYLGPLEPGKYEFIGEFHEATARGVIEAQ
jgi:Cupredoxin-like domain